MLIDYPDSRYDLIVIGGAMAGASFACAVEGQAGLEGLSVLVVEAGVPAAAKRETLAQESAFDARSTALSWGSSQILQRFGLWDELVPTASPIREIQVSDLGRLGGTRLRAIEQGTEALGYVVENHALVGALHRRLKQSRRLAFAAPMRVSRIEPITTGMRLTLRQGLRGEGQETQVEGALVVLADGGKSPVCQQLGIAHRYQDYGQHALAANIAFEHPHRGVAYERFTETGPIALLPLADTGAQPRGSLVWSLSPQQAAEYKAMSAAALLPRLQARFGNHLGRITRLGQRACYPLVLNRAQEQVRPGLVLLGNVAHTLHPVAGQGLNLTLRDCEALVKTLTETLTKPSAASLAEACRCSPNRDLGRMAVLQAYAQRQAGDQERTIRLTDGLVSMFSSQHPAQVLLRKSGLLALDTLPSLRRRFALLAMGMH